jgi:hypothetical protein
MFGIFLSALFSVLGWIFRSALVKFVAFFALFFVGTEFVSYLAPKLPGASGITQAFASLPPGMWYFLDMFKLGTGLQMVLAAYVTRFAIRRIPVIG